MGKASHQDMQWGLGRLLKEISLGRIDSRVLWQFVRFCAVGTSNAVIDFGVLNAVLAVFPTRAAVPLLVYNSADCYRSRTLISSAACGYRARSCQLFCSLSATGRRCSASAN